MRNPHTAISLNAFSNTIRESAAAVKRKLADQGPAYAVNTFIGRLESRSEMNFRGKRRFVWAVDASKVFQLAAPGFGVKSFGVASFTLRQGRVYKDFKKLARFKEGAGVVPLSTVGADERDDRDQAGVDKQPCDFRSPANIFIAIGFGEAEVLIQAEANFVTIEPIGVASGSVQASFQRVRDCGFACRGKACEPKAEWLLELEFGARLLVNVHRLSNKACWTLNELKRLQGGPEFDLRLRLDPQYKGEKGLKRDFYGRRDNLRPAQFSSNKPL